MPGQDGRAELMALQRVDAERAQHRGFGRSFHRFGHGHRLEMPGEGDERAQEGLLVGVAVDGPAEAAVQLDDVEAEVAQVAIGRGARPEIVQREGDAPGPPMRDEGPGAGKVRPKARDSPTDFIWVPSWS